MAIQAPTGPDVCWIRSFGEWQEAAKANANLIAAAPVLLEALKLAHDRIIYHAPLDDALSVIGAAITQALGSDSRMNANVDASAVAATPNQKSTQ